jgi:hypothetical protein
MDDSKDVREKAKQESVGAQLKLFGDIIKNLAPQFPSDPADIPMFFESIEKVFVSVESTAGVTCEIINTALERTRQVLAVTLRPGTSKRLRGSKRFLAEGISVNSFSIQKSFRSGEAPVTKPGHCFVRVLRIYSSTTVVAEMLDTILNGCFRCLWRIALRQYCHRLV